VSSLMHDCAGSFVKSPESQSQIDGRGRFRHRPLRKELTSARPWWPDALPVWFIQYPARRDRDEKQDSGAIAIAAVTLVVRDLAAELPEIAAFATVDAKESEFAVIGGIGSVAAIPRGGALELSRQGLQTGLRVPFQREGQFLVVASAHGCSARMEFVE
jgi:hypothetical protein